jgi:hypothetical protein
MLALADELVDRHVHLTFAIHGENPAAASTAARAFLTD